MATIPKAKVSAYKDLKEDAVLSYVQDNLIALNDALLNDKLKNQDLGRLKTLATHLDNAVRIAKYFEQGY